MSAHHTPGPWQLHEHFVKGQWGNSDRWVCEITCPNNNLIVAEIPEYRSYPEDTPAIEANARLIAASPTMYESLVKTEELLSFHEGSAKPEFDGAHPTVRINGEDFANLLADIRAALSKAAEEGV